MGPQTDLNLFKEKAAAVQVVISEITDLPAAFDYAADLTIKQGGKSMAAFGWEGQERSALEDACRRAGVSLVADNLREHAADLHTALTLADWGIAETGSLVLDSGSEDLRLATMLAETHIAVLPLSRLRPDSLALEDEMNRLDGVAPQLPGLHHRGLPHRRHRAGPHHRGPRPPGIARPHFKGPGIMINTAQNLKEYKKRLKQALDNKFLRAAMGTFATAYKEAQGRIFEGVDCRVLAPGDRPGQG